MDSKILSMNLEHLRNFLKVAEKKNISAAARDLRMSQPALSRQMAVFESDTGWSLLQRGAKSISLTKEGRVVERLGKKLIENLEEVVGQMRREIAHDEIRIGYAPTIGNELLQKPMARFSKQHPNVRVNLSDCTSEQMVNGLRRGEFDIILGVNGGEREFSWITMWEESAVLAVPNNHALAKKREIKPADLDGERLLLLSRNEYPGYWDYVMAYFIEHKINAKVAGEFDGISSLRLGVEAELGISLLSARSDMGTAVKLKPLTPPPAQVEIGIGYLTSQGLTKIQKEFVENLCKCNIPCRRYELLDS